MSNTTEDSDVSCINPYNVPHVLTRIRNGKIMQNIIKMHTVRVISRFLNWRSISQSKNTENSWMCTYITPLSVTGYKFHFLPVYSVTATLDTNQYKWTLYHCVFIIFHFRKILIRIDTECVTDKAIDRSMLEDNR